MTHIWTARFTNKPGTPEKCRASVHSRETQGWMQTYQCARKPTVFRCVDGAEYGFCKQHDPVEVETRNKARHQQWAEESRQREERYAREKQTKEAMDACKAAIEQIAAGHNDPRALAVETLALFPSSQILLQERA